jgi:aminopeptidase
MKDPRTERMAKTLIDYSANIQPGDRILLEAETAAEPLVRALFERTLERGGHPHLMINLCGQVTQSGFDDLLLKKANEEQLDYISPFYQMAYEQFESRIRIHSSANTKSLTGVDPEQMAKRAKATQSILEDQFRRGDLGEFKWVTTQFPTLAYAQDAEMSFEAYETFLYKACHVDESDSDPVVYWREVEAEQQRLVEALAGHDKVVVRSPYCDFGVSIKDRVFSNACGHRNMPDGEIFTGPVEESASGWIHFNFPAVYRGSEATGVKLRFEEGKVVDVIADKNQALIERMLNVDAGAGYLGEFAFGTNYGIQSHTKNILFDEKIGGSFHIAFGAGYPQTGSKNKSAIHWDMICDLREESEILLDGDLIYKDGYFQV